MKGKANYLMASAFALFAVSTGATLWLYLRYQDAAAAFEKSISKIHIDNGKVIVGSSQPQAAAAESLRMFITAGVLTLVCAAVLVAVVLWRRKQRLGVSEKSQGQKEQVVA